MPAFLVLGLVLRVAHWTPGLGSDDSRYMNYAATIAAGRPLGVVDHAAVRIGYEAVLGLAMALFGSRTLVCGILGLVTFCLAALLLHAIARRLSSPGAARTALFLYAVLPIGIVGSSRVLPDELMFASSLAAMLLYLRILDRPDRAAFGRALLGGLVLGVSAWIKETALCAAFVLFVDLLARRLPIRRKAALLAGAALGGAVATATALIGFAAWTGDPLYPVHALSRMYGGGGFYDAEVGAFSVGRLFTYLRVAASPLGAFGLHGYLLVAAIGLVAARREHRLGLPLLWIAVFAAYLSAGSASWSRYVLVPQQPRYFLPVLGMGCVVVGAALRPPGRLGPAGSRRLAVAAAVLLVAVGLVSSGRPREGPGSILPTAELVLRRAPPERARTVLLDGFVARMPLEYRGPIGAFPRLSEERALRDTGLVRELEGRTLIVPDHFRFADVEGRLRRDFAGRLVAVDLRAPAWPPYLRPLLSSRPRHVAWAWSAAPGSAAPGRSAGTTAPGAGP